MAGPALTIEQYVEQGGQPCPNCGDTRFVDYIKGWEQPDYQTLRRLTMCGECKARWYDTYALEGYTRLKVEELDA